MRFIPKIEWPTTRPWHILTGVKPRTQLIVPKINKMRLLQVIKQCADEYSWTPDADQLEEYELTPVFIHCNLMHGGIRHPILKDIYVAKDENGLSINYNAMTFDRFVVWQTRNGKDSYPVPLTPQKGDRTISLRSGTVSPYPVAAHVKGKVYMVLSRYMKEIDKAKQNGVEFRRKQVLVHVPYRTIGVDTGAFPSEENVSLRPAWMYIGVHKFWDDKAHPIHMDKCPLYDYTAKVHEGVPYFLKPTKKWINEPWYFFPAKEVSNL